MKELLKKRYSLAQQIEEVELELKLREEVYRRRCATGRMKTSMADYRMARMQSVRDTLVWLQQHEDRIKRKLGAAT